MLKNQHIGVLFCVFDVRGFDVASRSCQTVLHLSHAMQVQVVKYAFFWRNAQHERNDLMCCTL
jgi:hypothetical protein